MAARDIYDEILHPERVLTLVRDFIEKNRITCSESVSQNDHVIVNAYDFIEELAEAAGYAEGEEDEDITDGDFDSDNAGYGDD
jgi:hypothetical protein